MQLNSLDLLTLHNQSDITLFFIIAIVTVLPQEQNPILNLEKSILATHADGGNQSKTFGCQHQNSAAYKLGYAFSHSIALKKESNN